MLFSALVGQRTQIQLHNVTTIALQYSRIQQRILKIASFDLVKTVWVARMNAVEGAVRPAARCVRRPNQMQYLSRLMHEQVLAAPIPLPAVSARYSRVSSDKR